MTKQTAAERQSAFIEWINRNTEYDPDNGCFVADLRRLFSISPGQFRLGRPEIGVNDGILALKEAGLSLGMDDKGMWVLRGFVPIAGGRMAAGWGV